MHVLTIFTIIENTEGETSSDGNASSSSKTSSSSNRYASLILYTLILHVHVSILVYTEELTSVETSFSSNELVFFYTCVYIYLHFLSNIYVVVYEEKNLPLPKINVYP